MQKIQFILVFIAVAMMTACGGMNLSGGGTPGRFVQDGVPSDTIVWTWDYDLHGERDSPAAGGSGISSYADIIWVEWTKPVPCPDIRGVDWWQKDGEIRVLLTAEKYGGKYLPRPARGVWEKPDLALTRERENEPDDTPHFSRAQAEELAAYCGVKLQVR